MNKNRPIVEVIEEYPILGEFLLFNDVDCVNCSIKTCLLKDILDIHNFTPDDQTQMYAYMEKLINGEESEMKKFIPSKVVVERHNIIQTLMDEHKYVIDLVYLAEYLARKKNLLTDYKEDLDKVIHYFKTYADDYHHGKEEQLLFSLYPENEAVKIMLIEHQEGRDYRKILLESDDEALIKKTLKDYGSMLKDHIHKEDEILFPYLDRVLADADDKAINEVLEAQDTSIREEVIKYITEFNDKEFNR